MRKIERVSLPTYVARLRCRKCGRKKTFYCGFSKKSAKFPTAGWNGWNLKDTELCPICSVDTEFLTHGFIKSRTGRIQCRKPNESAKPKNV